MKKDVTGSKDAHINYYHVELLFCILPPLLGVHIHNFVQQSQKLFLKDLILIYGQQTYELFYHFTFPL